MENNEFVPVKGKDNVVMMNNLKSPLNTISISPDNNYIVVAGREVLKILSLKKDELLNVTQNLKSGRFSGLQYSTSDVKWCPFEQSKEWIATGSTNGSVLLWNINSIKKLERSKIVYSHNRTVHRISWHNPGCLMSCSQDGLIKYRDTREGTDKESITFDPKSGPVRDIQFYPFYPNYFASALDNGSVQVWDLRSTQKCKTKIVAAHNGLVMSVDWHPEDSSLVASGGRDGFVRIWNLNNPKVPVHSIQTIATVGRVSWRNGHKNQIATCSNILDFEPHIWDITSKNIPYASLPGHRDVVSGMIWVNQNTQMVTCSQDGGVILHEIKNAYFPRQHLKSHVISWNPTLRNQFAYIAQPINRTNPEYANFLKTTNPKNSKEIPLESNAKPETYHYKRSISIHSLYNPITYTNFQCFEFMALNYRLSGDSVSAICQYNASVANLAHQIHLKHVWNVLKSFVDDYERFDPKEIEPNSETIFDLLFHGSRRNKVQIHRQDKIEEILPLKKPETVVDVDVSSILDFNFDHISNEENNLFNMNNVLEPILNRYSERGDEDYGTKNSVSVSPIRSVLDDTLEDTSISEVSLISKLKEKKGSENERNFFDPSEYFNIEAHSEYGSTDESTSFKNSMIGEGVIPSHLSDEDDDDDDDDDDDEVYLNPGEENDFLSNKEDDRLISFGNYSIQNFIANENVFSNPFQGGTLSVSNDNLSMEDPPLSSSANMLSLNNSKSLSSSVNSDKSSLLSRSVSKSFQFSPFENKNFLIGEHNAKPHNVVKKKKISKSLNEKNKLLKKKPSKNKSSSTKSMFPQSDSIMFPGDFEERDSNEEKDNRGEGMFLNELNDDNNTEEEGEENSAKSSDSEHLREVEVLRTLLSSNGESSTENIERRSSKNVFETSFVEESRKICSKKKIRLEEVEKNDYTLPSDKNIKEIVNFLADNGDVQTCTFIVYILRDYIKFDSNKTLQWAFSYIDLLQQHKLYNCSNQIISIWPDAKISNMNKKETVFHASCGSCNQAIFENNSVCLTCKKYTCYCSICRLPIKGLIAWCKGCGHGGHLKEIQTWKSVSDKCPVPSCNHLCFVSEKKFN
eukprot:TRINITY_DN4898_c0_g1_i1.p1 TRINITY_DN4898_c0_g1~~TRINITY_DN4898_c0_g1_i1.p1  ORF type:complete len:1081 (+),score=326.98 TRINITY_DN4898_c0_g1_i1:129-3371(+)